MKGFIVDANGEKYIIISPPNISEEIFEKDIKKAWMISEGDYALFEEWIKNIGYEIYPLYGEMKVGGGDEDE